ncbi:MAG: hypothetical protein H7Y03_08130 [Chitinophagaceae bacterium]|nr:hypothetical protein [Chitinophagaceae bacterium]
MKGRFAGTAEIVFIVIIACVPLFVTFPYRVNIFLTWEGAYRMSEGQLPFKDFGTPLGGMFWVIPALFFKIFGTQMITLVKAQVFINIISGLAFRSILKSLSAHAAIRFVAIFLFCLSFSFSNFWPWYNHTVIVYELIALAFLFRFISNESGKYRFLWLAGAALFIVFSLLTKQDGGGLALLISIILIACNSLFTRNWKPLLLFSAFFTFILILVILAFSQYSFGYWFNHGQAPHTARVSISEVAGEFFYGSQWIKFYLFLIILLLLAGFRSWKEMWSDKKIVLFVLLTISILGEAAVFQVTSYTPPDNNIFFHSFAVALILTLIAQLSVVSFDKKIIFTTCLVGIMLWWSTAYWKYCERIIDRILPDRTQGVVATQSPSGENLVNKNTYMISNAEPEIPMSEWVYTDLRSFDGIYMPKPTADGINRLLNMELVKVHKTRGDLKVLNMCELTPLAVEIPFQLERNEQLPLWYHLGVGMFNQQAALFENRIASHYYDLVLFEFIPTLNNFYPFRVRDSLKINYKMIDQFPAPRRGDTKGMIEIYVRP